MRPSHINQHYTALHCMSDVLPVTTRSTQPYITLHYKVCNKVAFNIHTSYTTQWTYTEVKEKKSIITAHKKRPNKIQNIKFTATYQLLAVVTKLPSTSTQCTGPIGWQLSYRNVLHRNRTREKQTKQYIAREFPVSHRVKILIASAWI
jgi:hypothetical protein